MHGVAVQLRHQRLDEDTVGLDALRVGRFPAVHGQVDLVGVGDCDAQHPQEQSPPPLAVPQPVVWAVLPPQLVSSVDTVHGEVVVVDDVQLLEVLVNHALVQRVEHLAGLVHEVHHGELFVFATSC